MVFVFKRMPALVCFALLFAALLAGCLQEKKAGEGEPTPPAPPSDDLGAYQSNEPTITPTLANENDEPPAPPSSPN